MNITITLNGLKVHKDIPESWSQVKFKHFLKLHDHPKDPVTNQWDNSVILSVLTGIDVETIKKAKITNVDDLLLVLSFFQKDSPLIVPETILGYNVPKDLGFETVAQYEDLKLHLKEAKENKATEVQLMANYPLYCGIYACSQKYGEYDWEKAGYMVEEFMEAPATEVLAIGNFTLLKLIGLNLGIRRDAPKPITRLKNWRLVLKCWVMSLVLPVQLRIWKRRLHTKKASL